MGTPLRTYKLIAISGLANSGKDTAASMLHYILNAPKCFQTYWWYEHLKKWPFKNKWKVTAFAKPLKQTLAIILNKSEDWFEDRDHKENYYVNLSSLKVYSKDCLQSDILLSENKFQKIIKSEEPLDNENLISIRQLMQYYGTSICRKYFGEDIWINATLNKIESNMIISDCRFKNEFIKIKENSGIVIYINRPSATIGNHQSERECVEMYHNNWYDAVIENDSDLKTLFKNIKKCITSELL